MLQLGSCGLVELGATWLHGLRGSPVYELALQKGFMDGTEQRSAGMAAHLGLATDSQVRVHNSTRWPGGIMRQLTCTTQQSGAVDATGMP